MTSSVWLDDPAARDPDLVGRKAATLSWLCATQRIPPGYVLTTEALAQAEAHGVECLRSAVADAHGQLVSRVDGRGSGVAVRSSAADEDGVAASFAGQYDSYLNVQGVDAVLEAVQRCLQSARAPRALEYRHRHGLDTPARLAVLIQRLVPADVSAVVFSANPITSCNDEIVVSASWGLGESVVGGTVTPDTYVVSKDDLAVVSRKVADKSRMTVPVTGGTREVDVPLALRSRAALDDSNVVELASLALELERALEQPVDVEAAYHEGDLYLLQSRPITTLVAR